MSPNIGISRRNCGRTKQRHLVHTSTEGWLRRLGMKGTGEGEAGFPERGQMCTKTEIMRERGTHNEKSE